MNLAAENETVEITQILKVDKNNTLCITILDGGEQINGN
jgi:hypothetical protein